MLNNPHHSSITFYTTNNLKTSFDELVKFKRNKPVITLASGDNARNATLPTAAGLPLAPY